MAIVYLREVQAGALASVVVVPVHVKDLLALDGEQARQDALRETSS